MPIKRKTISKPKPKIGNQYVIPFFTSVYQVWGCLGLNSHVRSNMGGRGCQSLYKNERFINDLG